MKIITGNDSVASRTFCEYCFQIFKTESIFCRTQMNFLLTEALGTQERHGCVFVCPSSHNRQRRLTLKMCKQINVVKKKILYVLCTRR